MSKENSDKWVGYRMEQLMHEINEERDAIRAFDTYNSAPEFTAQVARKDEITTVDYEDHYGYARQRQEERILPNYLTIPTMYTGGYETVEDENWRRHQKIMRGEL